MAIYSYLFSRGQMERSTVAQDYPIAKAAFSLLQEISSSLTFAGWNNGRIICQQSQLRRILSGTESSSKRSKKDKLITLSNSPLTLPGGRTSKSGVQTGKISTFDSRTETSSRTELLAGAV